MPKDSALGLEHVTPGRFYSVGTIFMVQALIDNVAVWLCDAMPLSVSGGERHFLSVPFMRELRRKQPTADEEFGKHRGFIEEVNQYRQVWIHTISGGAIPTSDIDPFANPETAQRFLGVPLDPAIQPDQENYRKRVEQCAKRNDGRYLYRIENFTSRTFEGASAFYLGWLRFAQDHVR